MTGREGVTGLVGAAAVEVDAVVEGVDISEGWRDEVGVGSEGRESEGRSRIVG